MHQLKADRSNDVSSVSRPCPLLSVPCVVQTPFRPQVRSALTEDAKKDGVLDMPDAMFAYFIERVRSNLHIVLCMSPVGDPFRDRMRKFPSFVNCTTIDWFSEWPQDALLEVAERYLESMDLGDDEVRWRGREGRDV